MRLLFILTALFLFPAHADPFYDWTYNKMIEVFDVEYQDNIVLNSVNFIDSWEGMELTGLEEAEEAGGVFFYMHTRDKNDIYVLASVPEFPFDEDYMDSILVHEYSHFLTKKAAFSPEEKSKKWDMVMVEAIAYYIQDLWLREHTDHGLLHYYEKSNQTKEVIKDFPPLAYILHKNNQSRFFFNSIYYFKNNAPGKFKKIIEKNYISSFRMLR